MYKLFILSLFCVFTYAVKAQTLLSTNPATQPYGKIDMADLQMTSCDFEKDANAEVLFEKADLYFDINYNIMIEYHKRIKIFNEYGRKEANIRIEYYGGDRSESIYNVQAQTINVNNGSIEVTKIDKKLIYTETVDKLTNALVFTFPNVKLGSVIEFKYIQQNFSAGNFPDWYFQSDLPTRYSEFSSNIPEILHFKNLVRVNQAFVKNIAGGNGRPSYLAMANIPSLSDEPFMSSRKDNLQCILYQLISITQTGNFTKTFSDSWNKIGKNEIEFDEFGGQFKRNINGEEAIINKVKSLLTKDDKIAYIFNEVKNSMKWNEKYRRYTNDGTVKAWDKKEGNSTEINLIVYHLLNKAGITAYPLLVSTRKNGKVNPAYPSRYQFNTAVTYVPIDSITNYVLDASNKYGCYREIPANILNSFGLLIDKDKTEHNLIFIQKITSVRNVILVKGNIKPDSKMEGSAEITSFGFNRINRIEDYMINGEKKYIDYLRDNDNNLRVSSLKLDNMLIDTLPLIQNILFNMDLVGSDDHYIFFKPNLFTSINKNPFLSEKRFSDIDFSYCNDYTVIGTYSIPTGYKSDASLKSVSMAMPDKAISFKRLVAEQEGVIMVRYFINYNKSIFYKENYAELRDFYKKMYEMSNEQIVLKKS